MNLKKEYNLKEWWAPHRFRFTTWYICFCAVSWLCLIIITINLVLIWYYKLVIYIFC